LLVIADGAERVRVELALAPLRPAFCTTRRTGRAALVIADERTPIAGLRRDQPTAALLVLLTSRRDVARVLDSGADGVLDHGLRPAELRARVRALLRRAQGTVAAAPAVRRLGALRIDFRARRVALAGVPLALGPREYALLACLAAEPGRVFTKGELRSHCWRDRPSCESGRSLETQIVRLRRRLGAHGSMLVTVWSVGYRLLEVPE
jgi:DNA-binding response OmpR family regulator